MPDNRMNARKKCPLCHNLTAKGHSTTLYDADDTSDANARLDLTIDPLRLGRTQEDGCRQCKVLCKALDGFVGKNWRCQRAAIQVDIVEKSAIKVTVPKKGGDPLVFELYSSRKPWPMLGNVVEVPSHSGSDETFEFTQKCIQDCDSNPQHRLCRRNPIATQLPTRVLDVGSKDGVVKLCRPKGAEKRYVALSHCWGNGPLLTTTNSTLAQREKRIDWNSLPMLFQDAVTITRRLGLRYLWIDSLCIIQDCRRDWEIESARMSHIYEGAYITVAGVDAPHSGQQCLTERPKTLKFKYENTTGKAFTIKARRVVEHHPDEYEKTPARVTGPLTRRAWALQEHVLCSRILHYTSTELIFECKSVFLCECRPKIKAKATTPGLLPKVLVQKKPSALYSTWHRLVAQYTLRNLTNPCDKLPAFSGIAKKIQTKGQSAYLAGLWRDNLAEDLLWSSAAYLQSPHSAERVDSYRAPSFSWASVDTQIQYEEREESDKMNPLIKIMDAECTLAGLNPLGEVADGWISVRGQVVKGILLAPKDYEFSYHLKLQGPSLVEVSPDSLLVEDSAFDEFEVMQKTVRRGKPSEIYRPFKVPVLCLLVGSLSNDCVSGLVLGRSSRVFGAYERVGMFSCGTGSLGAKEEKVLKIV